MTNSAGQPAKWKYLEAIRDVFAGFHVSDKPQKNLPITCHEHIQPDSGRPKAGDVS
jgi:hypothetical protein